MKKRYLIISILLTFILATILTISTVSANSNAYETQYHKFTIFNTEYNILPKTIDNNQYGHIIVLTTKYNWNSGTGYKIQVVFSQSNILYDNTSEYGALYYRLKNNENTFLYSYNETVYNTTDVSEFITNLNNNSKTYNSKSNLISFGSNDTTIYTPNHNIYDLSGTLVFQTPSTVTALKTALAGAKVETITIQLAKLVVIIIPIIVSLIALYKLLNFLKTSFYKS